MKTNVFLIRGLPGSGKTTYANHVLKAEVICEADDYFTRNGVYKFNPEQLTDAHNACFNKFVEAVKHNKKTAVCNTFSRYWELKKYIEFCKSNNIKFIIIKMNSQYNNVHGVPESAVENMRKRWERVKNEIYIY